VQFGLLGPIEVRHEGRLITIGRGHERVVLVTLLLNPNRLTPASRLIDALWTESPSSARGQLHNLISRLRSALGVAGHEVIVSHTGGYELRLGPHELDLHTFRDLVERGRTAATTGQHELAFELLTSALEVWRGPALADVPDEFAAQPRQAIHEENLATIEARFDAALATDRHDTVLSELTGLVAEHPHRERLHELRMTALVALGRRAEALAAYREVRDRFADDLGVEPGPILRQLEQRILRGEDIAISVAPRRATPRQLPPPPPMVVGRHALLGEIGAALRDRRGVAGPVVVLAGPGGVGKSTVAVAAARSVAGDFPDGQLHVDLRGTRGNPVGTHEIAGRLLRAIGMAGADLPDDQDERIATLRDRVADRDLLVVLDDAASEEQVRPLLPVATSCATVITSRRHLGALIGATHFTVPMLTPNAALRLVAEVIGDDRVRREQTAAATIVERCGFLPLAVCVAAARLAARPEWSLAELEQRLTDQHSRLDTLAVGDLNVRASIELGYQLLEPPARLLCRRLGLIGPSDWPAWVAGELVDGPVERILDDLVDAHLVVPLGRDRVGQPRYQVHDLIADFGRNRAEHEDDAQELTAALTRVWRGWLARSAAADTRLGHAMVSAAGLADQPAPTDPPAVRDAPADWFEAERISLVTTVSRAMEHGQDELAGSLALRLSGFLTMRSYEDDLEHVLEAVVASVRRHERHRLLMRLLNAQFTLYAQRNRYAALPTIAAEELALARRLDDVRNEVLALSHTGRAARMLCRFTEAADALERALTLCRREAAAAGTLTRVLAALATLHLELGRPRDALPFAKEVVRLDQDDAGQRLTAIHLRMHGVVLMELGEFAEAEQAFVAALDAVRAIEDDRGWAWIEHSMANLDLRRGRLAAAAVRLDRAARVHEQVRDQEGIAEVLRAKGDLALARKTPWNALAPLRRAAAIWQALDSRLEHARTHARLELALRSTGDSGAAEEHHRAWRTILVDVGLDEQSLRLPPALTGTGRLR
jgi:DNA-binding SARP family transcriptional activator